MKQNDYVGDMTSSTKFGRDRSLESVSAYMRNIALGGKPTFFFFLAFFYFLVYYALAQVASFGGFFTFYGSKRALGQPLRRFGVENDELPNFQQFLPPKSQFWGPSRVFLMGSFSGPSGRGD